MSQESAQRAADLASPPVAIRVFDPEQYQPHSPDQTLCEFIRNYFLPVVCASKEARQSTEQVYAEVSRRWKALTGDPPLAQIDKATCAEFVAKFRLLPGKILGSRVSANTIHKYCRHLQAVLRCTLAESESNPLGAGILPKVPRLPKPRLQLRVQIGRDLSLEQIAGWLVAAEGAQAPPHDVVTAPVWWQSLVQVAYNSGARIGELLALKWGWLEDVQWRWFRLPCEAEKTGREKLIYCNSFARQALKRMQPSHVEPTDRIFRFPFRRKTLHKHCFKMLVAAGIRSENSRADKHANEAFHLLRRSCATQAALIGGPDFAKMVLGHAGAGGVTGAHYMQMDTLFKLLEQLPQPPWIPPASEKQLSLF